MNALKNFLGKFHRYDYMTPSGSPSYCMLFLDPLFEFIIIADPVESKPSSFVCYKAETIIPQVFYSFNLHPQTAIYEKMPTKEKSQSLILSNDLMEFKGGWLLRLNVTFSMNRKVANVHEWKIVNKI